MTEGAPAARGAGHGHPGVLVAVSGMDGAGKTTFLEALLPLLEQGAEVVVTRQPSTQVRQWSPFRQAIAGAPDAPFDRRVTAGLVAWDRLATQVRVVEPALAAGRVVILERYAVEVVAFGQARGADPGWIQAWLQPLLGPDFQVCLDAPDEVMWRRLNARSTPPKPEESSLPAVAEMARRFREAAAALGASVVHTVEAPAIAASRLAEQVLSLRRSRIERGG